MEKLHYSIRIDAPREKVWNVTIGQETFQEWTKPFEPTSFFRGAWKEGEKMLFLMKHEDGTESGMSSDIAKIRYPEFISIRHLGMVNKGVEDTTSAEVRKWAPSYENYTLNEVDGGTEFVVDMDIIEEYKEMFEKIWPKALQKLKEICER